MMLGGTPEVSPELQKVGNGDGDGDGDGLEDEGGDEDRPTSPEALEGAMGSAGAGMDLDLRASDGSPK